MPEVGPEACLVRCVESPWPAQFLPPPSVPSLPVPWLEVPLDNPPRAATPLPTPLRCAGEKEGGGWWRPRGGELQEGRQGGMIQAFSAGGG